MRKIKTSMRYLLPLAVLLFNNACVTEPNAYPINRFKSPSHQERIQNLTQIKTQLALEYLQLGNYRQAVASIDEAIHLQKNNIDAWLVRAHIQQTLKQYQEAEHSFKHALHLNPRHPEANNNYGWFLCKHLNLPEKALIYFNQALSDPTYPTPHIALLNQALCLNQLGRYTDAELIFADLTERYPQWEVAKQARHKNQLDTQQHITP